MGLADETAFPLAGVIFQALGQQRLPRIGNFRGKGNAKEGKRGVGEQSQHAVTVFL